MRKCNDCKHAQWDFAKGGKLHPSGDGYCTYEVEIPQLPASKVWMGGVPRAQLGWINRNFELKTDCVYYARVEK